MTTGRINQVVTKPTQPLAPRRRQRKAGRLNRIHRMDTFHSNPKKGVEFPMPSLQLWLRIKSNASCSQVAAVRQNQIPPRQSVGIPIKNRSTTKHPKPDLFPSNPTQWVAHNQVPNSSQTPRRTASCWADTSKPQVRIQTQLRRMGSQGAGIRSAATGKSESTDLPI